MRIVIGRLSAVLAIFFTCLLLIGILMNPAALSQEVMGQSVLRSLAEVNVLLYLIAAWAYWQI